MSQPVSTIKDLADSARYRGIAFMGDAEFARLCLNFEKTLPDTSLNAVLHLMVEFQDPKTMQLGCCWLDENGYDNRSIEWLGTALAEIRREQK